MADVGLSCGERLACTISLLGEPSNYTAGSVVLVKRMRQLLSNLQPGIRLQHAFKYSIIWRCTSHKLGPQKSQKKCKQAPRAVLCSKQCVDWATSIIPKRHCSHPGAQGITQSVLSCSQERQICEQRFFHWLHELIMSSQKCAKVPEGQ